MVSDSELKQDTLMYMNKKKELYKKVYATRKATTSLWLVSLQSSRFMKLWFYYRDNIVRRKRGDQWGDYRKKRKKERRDPGLWFMLDNAAMVVRNLILFIITIAVYLPRHF